MDNRIAAGGLGAPQRAGALRAITSRSPLAVAHSHIPVYVINLPKDIDRWHRIEKSLHNLGVSPIRVGAVDGAERISLIRRLIKHDFATTDWALTPGEIGCALSHIKVWKKIFYGGVDAVVLEDDAEIPPRFKRFYFEDLPLFLRRCDIVKFEGLFFSDTSLSGPTLYDGSSTKLIATFHPTLGAAGYALTQCGAKALLSRAAKIKVATPVDYILARYHEHGAIFGETRPLIVRQAREIFDSNIEAERVVEVQRLRLTLNSRRIRARKVYRVFALTWRGMRRSIAVLRIVIAAKFLSALALPSIKRASINEEDVGHITRRSPPVRSMTDFTTVL